MLHSTVLVARWRANSSISLVQPNPECPLTVLFCCMACLSSGNWHRSAKRYPTLVLCCSSIACNTRQPSMRHRHCLLFLANGGAHGTACLPKYRSRVNHSVVQPVLLLSRITTSSSRHLDQRRPTIRHPTTRQTGLAMQARTTVPEFGRD